MLAVGITEAQFEMIQQLRANLYELRQYCLEQDIITSVAHPLYRVNDRLTVEHVEKLLVLFNRFEGINGTRDRRACELVNMIFRQLTPGMIERWANKHRLEPTGPTPWVKSFTGGSDDHSGLYLGNAHTVTPKAASVEEFLDHLRRGRSDAAGSHGTSSLLAHCFYQIAYSYYDHLLRPSASGAGHPLLGQLLTQMIEEPKPAATHGFFGSRIRSLVGRFYRARAMRRLSEVERMIVTELSEIFRDEPAPSTAAPGHDRVVFQRACRLSQTVAFSFLRRFEKHAREGRLLESIQSMASLAPVGIAIAPYLAAFKTQHKDEKFLRQVAGRFPAAADRLHRSDRRAWLTDTFSDINGVAVTVRTMGEEARRVGKPLTVLTCQDNAPACEADVVNFKPIGTFVLPEYPQQQLAFPPFLEVIDHLERGGYRELVISTPGPMGLVGLAAARLLGLRTIGIYHTDFPAYVRHLTQDTSLEHLAWQFMHWFYGSMDVILAPSDYYRHQLIRHGFEARNIRVMERGIDLKRFRPDLRDPTFFRRRGLKAGTTFLYVGRVSREKNLDALMRSFTRLAQEGQDVALAVVGDGPYLHELQKQHRHPRIVFTGYLHGQELATAFASADVFVFPSLTDTFGNVVLEAQASGLASIVSDRGGPQEIVSRHRSGLVVNMMNEESLSAAMKQLAEDGELRRTLADRGLVNARQCGWSNVLDDLWSIGDEHREEPVETITTREHVLTPQMMEFS
jgi:glycosyltransferase involved in cell wall biosynthesis